MYNTCGYLKRRVPVVFSEESRLQAMTFIFSSFYKGGTYHRITEDFDF
jgi:hypothetical protein